MVVNLVSEELFKEFHPHHGEPALLRAVDAVEADAIGVRVDSCFPPLKTGKLFPAIVHVPSGVNGVWIGRPPTGPVSAAKSGARWRIRRIVAKLL